MTEPNQDRRYRFGVFEADAETGELRRQGVRLRLNAQPFHVLLMLLDRPGNDAIQLDLFHDYPSNVALYDQWHQYFRRMILIHILH